MQVQRAIVYERGLAVFLLLTNEPKLLRGGLDVASLNTAFVITKRNIIEKIVQIQL